MEHIKENIEDPQSMLFKTKHEFWEKEAKKASKEFKDHLLDIEAIKIYALNGSVTNSEILFVRCKFYAPGFGREDSKPQWFHLIE